MDVLSPPPAPADTTGRRAVRVVADASLTLRVPLPRALRRLETRSTASGRARPVAATATATGDSDCDASWEERNWAARDAAVAVRAARSERADEWPPLPPPPCDLPEDFPRLVVNLTRVQRQCAAATTLEEAEWDVLAVCRRVRRTLHEQCTHFVELLFDRQWAFHCTYGTSRPLLDGLHAAFPTDVFALLDYPTDIDGVPLHAFLHTLSSPSRWKSVEYLRTCLCRCSRDLQWKSDVLVELELLAETEFAQYERTWQEQSDEIDELTRLRDSFRAKLEKTRAASRANHKLPQGQQYLWILRQLEDVENRLLTLLEVFLKDPELDEDECFSAFANPGGESGVTAGTNVLDMVIAMVFSRLPRDFSQQTTTEEHFQMLFDHHIQILRLWKKDFGRLPLRSRVALQEESARDSEAGRTHVSSLREKRAGLDVSDEDSVVGLIEDCPANGGDVANLDEASLVCDREADNIGRGCDRAKDSETSPSDEADGYGADSDSDASEDDAGEVIAAQRQRHPRKRVPSKLGAAETVCALDRPRRRRTKQLRRGQKSHKSKVVRSESDADREAGSFQPFACTGAVPLLRLAKEKELF
ncbi:unnamed protein product [Hyaloperonospora brassicae]|uniref:Uncharacterized protein n=1 Tax=Hyaloperonospora brassicae TaxID=162125 RepID=A0AAV0T6H3_HYABA|nr:unnamed protein product [Hyaloperonospora brassicae]